MRMVEVFTTDVREPAQANYLIDRLMKVFPEYSINFDLEDCDRILRVESENIDPKEIIRVLNSENIRCEILS